MAREWQQTRMREYVMPDAVYYQSIWAVRDLSRMEARLKELIKREQEAESSSMLHETGVSYIGSKTEKKALEITILEERIKAIKLALGIVPAAYRAYILSNIILKNEGKNFPNKLWRIWKQRFLYAVAKNLSIM